MTNHDPKENVMTTTATLPAPRTIESVSSLQEKVEALGFDWDALPKRIIPEAATWSVRMRPATTSDGRIFVRCSGEALFAFHVQVEKNGRIEDSRMARPMYLVRDDEAGLRWDALRSQGVGFHQMKDHGLTSYRPHAVLTLVQSA